MISNLFALSDYIHLQERWVSDRGWVDIINFCLGLDEEKHVTNKTFNKYMKMLKLERKNDVKDRMVYHTIKYHVANYTKDPVYCRKMQVGETVQWA